LTVDGALIPIDEAIRAADLSEKVSISARGVLEAGPDAWARLGAVARDIAVSGESRASVSDVELCPPIADPEKIICLGLNYRDHAAESNLPIPPAPMLFAKFRNSLIGPTDPIVLPTISDAVDYEAELAVVVGRRCRDVAASEALSHLAGLMAFNDVSARDLQHQTTQWLAGKALDTFAPCGPALVFLDEIDDVQDLAVRTRVNGIVVQDGSTADMIFGVAETISFLSRLMTLEPGDIVATGTPAGVGFSRDPKLFLRAGDVVEVEIDGVGTLTNPVAAEAPDPSLAGLSTDPVELR